MIEFSCQNIFRIFYFLQIDRCICKKLQFSIVLLHVAFEQKYDSKKGVKCNREQLDKEIYK